MRKIFITGGASALGTAVLEKIKDLHDITALVHKTPIADSAIKTISGGLDDISLWQKSLEGCEVVLHLAAITHSQNAEMYEKINAEGTRKLIEGCKNRGIKHFIFVSTRAIGKICGEYGASKELAEKYVTESHIPYTILRLSEVYDEKFETREGIGMLANLVSKYPIVPYFASNDIEMAPLHIDDARDSILAAVETETVLNKTYTVTGPETLSMDEVLDRISEYKKVKRFLLPIPDKLAQFIFYMESKILGNMAPDQMERLICRKEKLSEDVITDLHVTPRNFLKKVG